MSTNISIGELASSLQRTHIRDSPKEFHEITRSDIFPEVHDDNNEDEEEEEEEEEEIEPNGEMLVALTPEERERVWYEKHKHRAQDFVIVPAKYRPSRMHPKPPVLHFGVPVTAFDLLRYAILKETCAYDDFVLEQPYFVAPQQEMLVSFYTNYNFKTTRLIAEDEQNLIDVLKGELDLDSSVIPKWYFPSSDPWRPGMPETN
ncbi:hypothetical protein EUX98_g4047 [Antrodiella citrinella]|uniref:Uncharacterized protein n=1 Tax=Antrodiella citrinella TaxID=2447956 RepID=A0A4S4MV00_9APHY|nr:hypothetical protein EUX98_g4047 [Antrodiella citrinella]